MRDPVDAAPPPSRVLAGDRCKLWMRLRVVRSPPLGHHHAVHQGLFGAELRKIASVSAFEAEAIRVAARLAVLALSAPALHPLHAALVGGVSLVGLALPLAPESVAFATQVSIPKG